MVTPAVTTVAQSFEDIGVQVVRAVVHMSQHPQSEWPAGVHYVPYHLVERNSVGKYPRASKVYLKNGSSSMVKSLSL